MLSTSKENGGLLASIGLKKGGDEADSIGEESQEEDPHKKSDLFDTSKDRGKAGAAKKDNSCSEDGDFDLGFGSGRKGELANKEQDAKVEGTEGLSESNDMDIPEDQRKAVEDQFMMIYEKDPELRKALEKSDVSTFTIEEKC